MVLKSKQIGKKTKQIGKRIGKQVGYRPNYQNNTTYNPVNAQSGERALTPGEYWLIQKIPNIATKYPLYWNYARYNKNPAEYLLSQLKKAKDDPIAKQHAKKALMDYMENEVRPQMDAIQKFKDDNGYPY